MCSNQCPGSCVHARGLASALASEIGLEGFSYGNAKVFLCVKAKADPDPSRGLEGDEICIDMANQERVDMKSESNIIVEFFFSASGQLRASSAHGSCPEATSPRRQAARAILRTAAMSRLGKI